MTVQHFHPTTKFLLNNNINPHLHITDFKGHACYNVHVTAASANQPNNTIYSTFGSTLYLTSMKQPNRHMQQGASYVESLMHVTTIGCHSSYSHSPLTTHTRRSVCGRDKIQILWTTGKSSSLGHPVLCYYKNAGSGKCEILNIASSPLDHHSWPRSQLV